MSEAPVFPRLDDTMGAVFVGVLISAALWGISCMQTYEYFTEYQKDSWLSKAMVYTVFFLDTIHQIMATHTAYTYLISEHFNTAYLNVIVWSIVAQILVSAFIGLMVQSFFVYRIWILSHQKIYAVVPAIILVIAEFCLSLAYFIRACSIPTYDQLPENFRLSQSVNIVAAAGDITIAASLVYLLSRSKTGFSKSDSIVKQLILYSLNTGFLTSVCALLSLITITIRPNTFIYITFYFVLSRLYTNSLFATLNARKKLRVRAGLSHNSMGESGSPRSKPEPTFSIGSKQETSHHVSIRVDTETTGDDGTISKNGGYDHELSVFNDRDQKNPEHAV